MDNDNNQQQNQQQPKQDEQQQSQEQQSQQQSQEKQSQQQSSGSSKIKKFKKPLIIVGVILLLLIGFFIVRQLTKKDPPSTASQQTATETPAAVDEPEESTIPQGFVEYKNTEAGITFAYPEEWGEVKTSVSQEDSMKHNTAGTWTILTFSQNESVVGGLMSSDWVHNDTGHDGINEPGTTDLDAAKRARDYTKTDAIYADTVNQFGLVQMCSMFCSEDEPKSLLIYTIGVQDNPKYSAIQFYQYGDTLPSAEFKDASGQWDESKISAADPTQYFKEEDSRYVLIQQIAGTVRNL